MRSLSLLLCAGLLTGFALPHALYADTPAPAANVQPGSYALADAQDLEGRGLYHFLYLHPTGKFLMAAEWPGHESSRAAGRWSVRGGDLVLEGAAFVDTSQGKWETPFRRFFKIERSGSGETSLVPVPEKNRFGMLGWPNAYAYRGAQPRPPFPRKEIPSDEAGLLALIDALSARGTRVRGD